MTRAGIEDSLRSLTVRALASLGWILATRTSPIAASASKPDEVVQLLEALARTGPAELAALEVVWSRRPRKTA